jgi:steroid delta-isomerase-like uncharacterized protein
MTSEENKAIVRKAYEEAWNKKNVDALDELLPVEYDLHRDTGERSGREVIKDVIRGYHAAFPDLHVTIERLVAEGEWVVMRGVWSGTHLGTMQTVYGPMEATGREMKWDGTHLFRIADGRIAEAFYQTDWLTFYQQLGAIPKPGEG